MATRNQVLSLFGATPEQIMQRQAQEQAQALQAMQNPYQQVGAVIGTGLGRLFGGEDPEVTQQRELYAMLEGISLESPEQLREAAQSLASQFPDRALQLISMADQMETTAQQRSTSAAQAAAAQSQADFTQVPVVTMEQTIDPLTNQVINRPRITQITVPVGEAQAYRDRFNKAMEGPDTTPAPTARAIPENAVRFNTGVGTSVALINGEYYIVTDEGNLGAKVPDLKALGGLTQQGSAPPTRPPELPVVQERRQAAEEQITRNRMALPSTAAEDQLNPFSN